MLSNVYKIVKNITLHFLFNVRRQSLYEFENYAPLYTTLVISTSTFFKY